MIPEKPPMGDINTRFFKAKYLNYHVHSSIATVINTWLRHYISSGEPKNEA